ncbi:hypothetical protein R1T08_04780 [Streptomyces sp. SBC-4]|nr:hypothetical protein [Streptomyces sp. SBC-4]MDV5143617.1 hypothetical protein [Streptomyces sp. SBC-4]
MEPRSSSAGIPESADARSSVRSRPGSASGAGTGASDAVRAGREESPRASSSPSEWCGTVAPASAVTASVRCIGP